jgi:hypothetical protein
MEVVTAKVVAIRLMAKEWHERLPVPRKACVMVADQAESRC